MSTALRCEEKLRLLVAYQQPTSAYCSAVSNMMILRISEEEFARLRDAAEKARRDSVAARDALEQHVKEHGC